MIRVAAIADMHFSETSGGSLRRYWSAINEAADILLIAGDLTTHGEPEQAMVLVEELAVVHVPIVLVLGNHEYQGGKEAELRRRLEARKLTVLEGERIELQINGHRLAVAGTKGFGGGFAGACGTAFGEPEMKAFVRHTERLAGVLEAELAGSTAEFRVALTHYSPIKETVMGERLEIFPFLGSYLLAEAIDRAGADLVVHGHAHHGTHKGVTSRGIPVRNVAMPMLRAPYVLFHLTKGTPS